MRPVWNEATAVAPFDSKRNIARRPSEIHNLACGRRHSGDSLRGPLYCSRSRFAGFHQERAADNIAELRLKFLGCFCTIINTRKYMRMHINHECAIIKGDIFLAIFLFKKSKQF